jgi:hypothetical protein
MDAERLAQEIALLENAYPGLEHRIEGEAHWVRIPGYPVPKGWVHEGATVESVEIAFKIPEQMGAAPYAFLVRPSLALATGGEVGNYTQIATCPWGADFGQFSWQPLEWVPHVDIETGANMLTFARSFAERLGELS